MGEDNSISIFYQPFKKRLIQNSSGSTYFCSTFLKVEVEQNSSGSTFALQRQSLWTFLYFVIKGRSGAELLRVPLFYTF